VALLILALVSCGGSASQEEMERLRQEVERLRAKVEQGGEENDAATAPPAILALFEQDATRGTLAGLQPGDTLARARERFGLETRSRSWTSDGRPVFQYEWELEAGVLIRLNADGDGRLEKVGVALDQERERVSKPKHSRACASVSPGCKPANVLRVASCSNKARMAGGAVAASFSASPCSTFARRRSTSCRRSSISSWLADPPQLASARTSSATPTLTL